MPEREETEEGISQESSPTAMSLVDSRAPTCLSHFPASIEVGREAYGSPEQARHCPWRCGGTAR